MLPRFAVSLSKACAPSKPLFPVHSLRCAKTTCYDGCLLTFLTLTADSDMRTDAALLAYARQSSLAHLRSPFIYDSHASSLRIPCWQLHTTVSSLFYTVMPGVLFVV